jgi:tRNA U34 2-thiouridine synthase MnmA/TrmU
MRNYLSFGGGVNSVAMMLLLLDEGIEFEAVYVNLRAAREAME